MFRELKNVRIKPLIILGAGASYDLVESNQYNDFNEKDYRPPLMDDIFKENDFYLGIRKKYSHLNGLVAVVRARMKKGKTFEEVITEIRNSKEEREQFKSEIPELKQYIAELFVNISYKNKDIVGNYHALFRNLKTSCTESMVVNFNYDYLAQKAISDVYGVGFNNLNDYLSDNIKLIHVHGSVLFSRNRKDDIKLEKELNNVVSKNPSITVPTTKSKYFSCPKSHEEALKNYLKIANVVIIIGWKGREDNFAKLLLKLQRVRKIIIAGGDMPKILENSGLNRFVCRKKYEETFSKLIEAYPDFN
jgi:hypothetical protein